MVYLIVFPCGYIFCGIKFLLLCSGVFIFFYPYGFIFFFYTTIFCSNLVLCFFFCGDLICLSPFDALQKRSFQCLFPILLVNFIIFLWLAACGGSINGMCDYCRLDFRIFLSFLASYFFDLECPRRYLYDPSNYHSSFLILIIHLPFL